MVAETFLSMLTVVCHFKKVGNGWCDCDRSGGGSVVCHFKKVGHRVFEYFKAGLAFTMAAFNLTCRHGLKADGKLSSAFESSTIG
jgi:hypothetical protein